MVEERQEGIGSGAGASPAEQEIRVLEQRLEEKKRALAEQSGVAKTEKEMFREVVRERMESILPAQLPAASHVPPAQPSPSNVPPPHNDAVQGLVAQALSGNIADAVEKAYRESPYLMDALHDRLVDEYYDKLVALRKIDAW